MPSDTFTGSLFNADRVPAAGSGFANATYGSAPDLANIPAADAFEFTFGSYVFTLADDPLAMIHHDNGKYDGFSST